MKYTWMAIVLALLSCAHSKESAKDDAQGVTADSAEANCMPSEDEDEEYYWIPQEYRQEHALEWEVVRTLLKTSDYDFELSFEQIDSLVMEYVRKKGVELPLDSAQRVQKLEEICSQNFNIKDYYDGTGYSMRMGYWVTQQYDDYVLWLYEREARKRVSTLPYINLDKEFALMDELNDAMYDVCDSVACILGSGGYRSVGHSNISWLSELFRQDMFKSVLGAELERRPVLNVPLDLFDRECDLTLAYETGRDMNITAENPSATFARFKASYHRWHDYRTATAASIDDARQRAKYLRMTNAFARSYLLHLKNRFEDIGCSPDETILLPDSCTNQELLDFSFEAANRPRLND